MSETSLSDQALANLAQVEQALASTARPYVVINERELSVLRRGLTKHGWKRGLYFRPASSQHGRYVGAGLRSVADRWLQRELVVPARAGRYHDFFCDCGSCLQVPDDLQVQSSYTCPACGARSAGAEYDAAVRYLQHNRLAGAGLSLALVSAIQKDHAYSDRAAQILLAYSEAYPGESADQHGMFQELVSEAAWITTLAQAHDLVCYSRSLNEQRRGLVEKTLFRAVVRRLQTEIAREDAEPWRIAALGAIGLALKDALLVSKALDAFEVLIRDRVTEDGFWLRPLHCQHFPLLSALVHFAEGCRRVGIDIYGWEERPGKSLKSMFLAPLWLAYPSFRLPALDDVCCDSFLPLDLYEIARRRWDEPLFGWVLRKGYEFAKAPASSDHCARPERFARASFYAFLFGRDLPGRIPGPAPRSRDFSSIGLCVLGNDKLAATLDYGPTPTNGHLDTLGFTLHAHRSLLVPDCGAPGPGSAALAFYTSTAAHNTVVVDGQSQHPATRSRRESYLAGEVIQHACAVADDCYPRVTHSRQLVLAPNMLVIRDVLTGREPHDYDWLVRCRAAGKLIGNYEPTPLDCRCYEPAKVGVSARVPDLCRVRWSTTEGDLALAQWACSDDLAVGLGECPGASLSESISLLVCRRSGCDAEFVTAIFACAPGEDVEFARDGCALSAYGRACADHVFVRGLAGEADSGRLSTDGELAVVSTVSGKTAGFALVGGTWLRFEGELLIECSVPADCLEVSFRDRVPAVRYLGEHAGLIKLKTSARATRLNGHRVGTTTADGCVVLRAEPNPLPRGGRASSRL